MSTEPTHSDERALVARASSDFEAFAELYRRYLPRVHAFAYRRTGSVEAAEDICSATFEAAFRNISKFHWRSGGFGPWLFRIASRQTVAHYRREGRSASERGQVAMARLAPGTTPAVDSAVDASDARLRQALDRIAPRYQRALSLRYLGGLDTTESAQAMGLNNAAFSVVLNRATNALRRELKKIEGGTENA